MNHSNLTQSTVPSSVELPNGPRQPCSRGGRQSPELPGCCVLGLTFLPDEHRDTHTARISSETENAWRARAASLVNEKLFARGRFDRFLTVANAGVFQIKMTNSKKGKCVADRIPNTEHRVVYVC
eukprot:COSAG02_NODE_9166_length_2304_cov_20.843991_1_plen_125_part_00